MTLSAELRPAIPVRRCRSKSTRVGLAELFCAGQSEYVGPRIFMIKICRSYGVLRCSAAATGTHMCGQAAQRVLGDVRRRQVRERDSAQCYPETIMTCSNRFCVCAASSEMQGPSM